jgi:hypothetical protein
VSDFAPWTRTYSTKCIFLCTYFVSKVRFLLRRLTSSWKFESVLDAHRCDVFYSRWETDTAGTTCVVHLLFISLQLHVSAYNAIRPAVVVARKTWMMKGTHVWWLCYCHCLIWVFCYMTHWILQVWSLHDFFVWFSSAPKLNSGYKSGFRVWVLQTLFKALNLWGEAVPLLAWTSPWGFRSLRLPEFLDNQHMNVFRLLTLRTGCLYSPVFFSARGWVDPSAAGRIKTMKNPSDSIGGRNCDLSACRATRSP